MVNLQGKKSNQLTAVKTSLEDNLKINPASSRLVDINNSIVNNRYRIKDLDSKNFETISLGGSTSQIVDNKIFIFGSFPQNNLIEVFDIMTLTKITTINTGSNATLTTSLAVDDNFIYFTKLTLVSTNRSVRVLKYDRRTLAFVSESPVVYTSINIVSYVMTSFHHNGFIFLGISEPDGGNIVKVSLTDYSTATLPYNVINVLYKISTGFFAMGTGTAQGTDNFRKPQFIDFNLNIIQYLPITLLASAQTRLAVQKDDYIYIANDAGVVTKYQISTNTIVKEVTIIDIGQIRGLQLVNNGILVQSNKGVILLYDFSLNLIKTWNYYNTTTAGGFMLMDNNFTIYTHSYKEPKFYKKQFIDLTKDVI